MHRPVLLDWMDLSWQRKKKKWGGEWKLFTLTHMYGDMQKGQMHKPDLTSVTQYEFQGYKE